MKISPVLYILMLSILFLACGTTKKQFAANPVLDRIMEQEAFKIAIKAAEPQVTTALAQLSGAGILRQGSTISRIDVTGEGYFLKLDGEKVSANLPYYGERQMGGGYTSDAGVKFNGIARKLEIVKDTEKQAYVLTFSIDSASENYFVTVDVGTNMNSTVRVRSSHRNQIRYTGKVYQLQNEVVTN